MLKQFQFFSKLIAVLCSIVITDADAAIPPNGNKLFSFYNAMNQSGITFGEDGRIAVASAAVPGDVKVFDRCGNQLFQIPFSGSTGILDVAINSYNEIVVVANNGSVSDVKVFDKVGNPLFSFGGSVNEIKKGVAVSKNGRIYVLTSLNSSSSAVKVYNRCENFLF